ncbi:hypothetical protein [Curtobacterium sp. 18060]|uniref:hypothetical protein n=1 Tax=Curtobacterium sp. 18060 TaxID=2681408 RepID=UPI00135968F0|nr:hypothetical protein [Curtobacterium sp. 18060]
MRTLLHAPRSRRRSIAAAALGALALVGSLLVATQAQALNDTGTGGVFTPATGRILDTAKGTGGFSTPMEAGKYRTIQVTGLAGVPDDGTVGAVSLNATVGTAPGNGTLFGRPDADTSRTSMLIYNGNTGEYVSNTAAIAVGADGTIQIMAETSARVILDVQGYYTANTDGTAAGGFVPVAGKRFVDTRSGLGAPKATIAPGKSVDIQVTGVNGVPAGASGAVVNLIAINSTSSDGNLTPYATGSTKPQNSLHYTPSATTSIQAQVALSADGKMTIANASSTINLVIDLQGYFTAVGKTGAVFTPGVGRAYDSRATGNTILAKNETRSIQIAGTAGVPVMGSGITAVVLTLVVAHGGSDGRAAVWADGAAKPDTTSINFQADEIRTNTVTVPLGTNGKISLNNVADATNYVIDVQGWYSAPAPAAIACSSITTGAWLKTVPSDGVDCSITARPADHSNETLSYILDDGEPVTAALSTTVSTKIAIHVPGVAGDHTLSVHQTQADGSDESTRWFATFGDWTTAVSVATPANGDSASMSPSLEVWTEGVPVPNAAVYNYSVWANDSGSGTPLITSGDQYGSWAIPDGTLVDGQTYSWSATVSADLAGQSGSLTTTPAVFVADSSMSDEVGAPDDASDYTPADPGSDATTVNHASQPTIVLASTRTMTPASVQGPKNTVLKCNKTYNYSNFQASFSLRRVCDSSVTAWGLKVSALFCAGATSNATEIGMQWWDHNTRMSYGGGGKHIEWCDYHFHGSMSHMVAAHYVSYYDFVSWRARKGFTTGTAWVDTNGGFKVSNQK